MLTKKRDLRGGVPLWSGTRLPRLPVTELKKDAEADAVVIGAGISGAMMAEELTARGLSVIIIDRRPPLMGSTMASTALLQHEIDVPLQKLARSIGPGNAARAWRRSKLALESLSARTQMLGIRCGLRRESSLYLAGSLLDPEELRHEERLRREIGLPAHYMGRRALAEEFGLRAAAALLTCDNLSAHPVKLAAGFLQAACRNGARLHSPLTAESIEKDRNGVTIRTAEGPCLSARHAILATGYEFPAVFKPRGHKIVSTWAFATRPGALRRPLPMVWEAANPYLYLRVLRGGRIICGGEDEDITDAEARDALTPAKVVRLRRTLRHLLPDAATDPDFAWSGVFGTTRTGLPLIGPVPHLPHCYAVFGYGGNGITFSRMAAEIVANLMMGGADPDADLFALS